MTDDRRDVAIVGGGVVGCAIARALSPAYEVSLFERGTLASGATARAAREVTMAPSYTDYPRIADYAIEFFREYDGTDAFEFVERDSLELVPPAREDEARRRVERLEARGTDVSFLEPATVERRLPRFDLEAYAGAVRYGNTGFLDPYALTTELASDAEDAGARIRTGTSVEALSVEGDRVVGVETTTETVRADRVVVAAGWHTPLVLEDYLELPVRPYRTQCATLEPNEPMEASFPLGWIPGEHVYFRPELNGDLLVGGWSFAEDDPAGASRDADGAFIEHVADLSFRRSFGESTTHASPATGPASTPRRPTRDRSWMRRPTVPTDSSSQPAFTDGA